MLAVALIASLWAQAEPAPAPPAPAPAAAAASPAPAAAAPPPAAPAAAAAPAPAGPATAPPAAAAPAPATAAPATAPPPVVTKPEAPLPANGVSVYFRYAATTGTEGNALAPSSGFSLGGEFERRFVSTRIGLELVVAFDLFFDRFAKDVVVSAIDPKTGVQDLQVGERTLTQSSFVLLQKIAWRVADLRFFVAGGPGVMVGFFSTPEMELRPGSSAAVQPVLRGVVGIDFALSKTTAAVVRADYNHAVLEPTFTTDTGASYRMFGDFFDVGIGLLVGF